MPAKRELAAARRFFSRALRTGTIAAEVTTDRATVYPRVIDELIPPALYTVEQFLGTGVAAAVHGVRPLTIIGRAQLPSFSSAALRRGLLVADARDGESARDCDIREPGQGRCHGREKNLVVYAAAYETVDAAPEFGGSHCGDRRAQGQPSAVYRW